MASLESDANVIAASLPDPSRFAVILERHFDEIFAFVARRVGAQLAEDIAAEAFVQAFKARGRYDAAWSDARPWLYGITTRVLSHHHRAESRRLRAYARSVDTIAEPDRTDDVDRRLDASATVPRLAEALANLRRAERDALLLQAWGGLRYDEIARALAVPVGTVRSRIHRARTRLRELLDHNGRYRVVGDLASSSHGRTSADEGRPDAR